MADSSETEEVGAVPAPDGANEAATSKRSEGPITAAQLRRLRWVVPVVWLVGVIVTGQFSGIQLAFLVLAGGVLVLVIALLWVSVQSLTGGSALGFEEALGMGAPSKVEEEKRAVLRALKDLEYERGVGKISPEDFAELSARYRAQAKSLMQSVDEALAPALDEAKRVVERRLAREGLLAESEPAARKQAEPEKNEAPEPEHGAPEKKAEADT
ncbi:MAG TPA: hypothetical protein VEX18_20960 [Polyangiaceae bacterium]|nr:hypothetical protein [Polyangiaceae bacterium]